MIETQPAYLQVWDDDNDQGDVLLNTPIQAGDIVYIADIDHPLPHAEGIYDITAASLEPITGIRYSSSYAITRNATITPLGRAVITRMFTTQYFETHPGVYGTFRLIHVQPIED